MDLLKRANAPLTPESWAAIDAEAKRVLTLNLAGRRLVDLDGPHDWRHAAVNTGRLRLLEREPVPGVCAGIRIVNPLVELRTPVLLPLMEVDSVPRGALDVDLTPVIEAAEAIARAEDNAIFNGYEEAGIAGIIASSSHDPLPLPATPAEYPHVIVEARERLRAAGIDGPYALALGTTAFKEIARAAEDGYAIRKRIEGQIVDGPLVHASSIQGAVLLSVRGGDFQLSVGQDLAVGYATYDKKNVELFITESFTFRVLETAAAVFLPPAR